MQIINDFKKVVIVVFVFLFIVEESKGQKINFSFAFGNTTGDFSYGKKNMYTKSIDVGYEFKIGTSSGINLKAEFNNIGYDYVQSNFSNVYREMTQGGISVNFEKYFLFANKNIVPYVEVGIGNMFNILDKKDVRYLGNKSIVNDNFSGYHLYLSTGIGVQFIVSDNSSFNLKLNSLNDFLTSYKNDYYKAQFNKSMISVGFVKYLKKHK